MSDFTTCTATITFKLRDMKYIARAHKADQSPSMVGMNNIVGLGKYAGSNTAVRYLVDAAAHKRAHAMGCDAISVFDWSDTLIRKVAVYVDGARA